MCVHLSQAQSKHHRVTNRLNRNHPQHNNSHLLLISYHWKRNRQPSNRNLQRQLAGNLIPNKDHQPRRGNQMITQKECRHLSMSKSRTTNQRKSNLYLPSKMSSRKLALAWSTNLKSRRFIKWLTKK